MDFLYYLGRFGYCSFNNMYYNICCFFIFVIIIMGLVVQIKMSYTYSKYSKIKNKNRVSGAVVARNILDSYGLQNIRVEKIEGTLSDHYDPINEVVRLSYDNYEGMSISAIGVAAHEVGHAVQHAKEYIPVKIRTLAVTTTKIGSYLYMPLIIFGLIFSHPKIAILGIVLFSFIVFFQFITLPVEFNASYRAIKVISSQKILDEEEVKGAKKVLWAAAMTYVVAFLSALFSLIRLILIVCSSRDND